MGQDKSCKSVVTTNALQVYMCALPFMLNTLKNNLFTPKGRIYFNMIFFKFRFTIKIGFTHHQFVKTYVEFRGILSKILLELKILFKY